MSGIDRFLAFSMAEVIKKELPKDNLTELEHVLFFNEGMSIKLAMEHFDKFDIKLKPILNSDSQIFEKKCLERIIKIKNSKDYFLVKVIDPYLIQKILDFWGDPETRLILNALMDDELTVPQILSKIDIAKTSVYRKIENLIISGLVIETKKILSESKKVSKHRCVFDKITMQFNSNNVDVVGHVSKKIFTASTIITKIYL